MDQKQISNVVGKLEQGILSLEGVEKLLAYLDSLHPDDLASVDSSLIACLKTNVTKYGTSWNLSRSFLRI